MVCAKTQGQHVRSECRSDPWFSCISVFEKMPLRCTFCTCAVPDVPYQSCSITDVMLQLTSTFKVMDLTNWLAFIGKSHTVFSSPILLYHPKCIELSDSLSFPSKVMRKGKKSPLGDWKKSVLTLMVWVMKMDVLGQAGTHGNGEKGGNFPS